MKGVLLVNLGSPDAATPEAVKPYLQQFLMDERVIDLPYWFRSFLVKGIILRTRPQKSAKAYQKIWWDEGSPLVVLSKRTQEKVQQLVDFPVALAMRYGNPSIEFGLQELYQQGVTDVFLMPLYPQYAMATTETVEVMARDIVASKFPNIRLSVLSAFYNEPEYIHALTRIIQKDLATYEYDHLIFSYHGVPERHIKKTDKTGKHKKIKIVDHEYCCTPGTIEATYCYRTHCFETTRQVVEKLQLAPDQYTQTFQSRLGMDKWLTPFTADQVVQLARQGVKRLAVVTPAFVADCIETLEEIEMEAGADFMKNGGESFHMIPCLNDDDQWTAVLAKWINTWAANGE